MARAAAVGESGADEGIVGRGAAAVPDRGRGEGDPLGVGRVGVGHVLPAVLDRRLEDGARHLVARLGDRDAERAAGAASRARAEVVILHRLVRGQRVRPGPAVIAARRQAVPVGLRAAHPHHPVHRRRPAEHPAAQPDLVLAVGRDRARLIPVEVPVAAERVVEPLRDVQQRVDGATAVLDEQHAQARLRRRQPPGHHAPCRPRAHDDVVELHTDHLRRLLSELARPDRCRALLSLPGPPRSGRSAIGASFLADIANRQYH